MAAFEHVLETVDAHTGGEPVRVIRSGLPPILGRTLAERKRYLKDQLDHFRTMLMQEPRGHKDMFGAVITPPCSEQAQYGILFLDNGGYLDMCGHSIIGVTTVLIETGTYPAKEPETSIVFETPAGLIKSYARVEGNRAMDISFANVPSFLYAESVDIDTPSVGPVACDVSFGGNFFAAVDAKSLGLSLCAENLNMLVHLGMEIRHAVNVRLRVQHPSLEHIDRVELTEFYERADSDTAFTKTLVVFGAGQFDRSPCGTGVSATMATLHAKGKLALNSEFVAESIVGTRFKGKLTKTVELNGFTAVEPVLTGRSFLTGMHHFVVDPNDPVKIGFKVG
jgi:proline racemase/trans-L-3-hydroxyproline dehydratase